MELIDKDPSNPQYYYGVYRTYFGEGRLEDAQEYLNKATALRGTNIELFQDFLDKNS